MSKEIDRIQKIIDMMKDIDQKYSELKNAITEAKLGKPYLPLTVRILTMEVEFTSLYKGFREHFKKDIDSYFRKYSKKHNITQDYIIGEVNKVRYKTKNKEGD